MAQWIKASERLPQAQEAVPVIARGRYDVGSLNPFTGKFNCPFDSYLPEDILWLDESTPTYTLEDMRSLIEWCGGEEGFNLIDKGETSETLLKKFFVSTQKKRFE